MTLWVAVHQGELPSFTFGGHRHTDSRDIMIFVCHVTFKNHVIRTLFHFMVTNPPRQVIILPSFEAIGTVIETSDQRVM